MSTSDKISNKVEDAQGKIKEGLGKATGDDELKAKGQKDQSKSDLKQAGEKVKDAFKSAQRRFKSQPFVPPRHRRGGTLLCGEG